MLSAQRSTLFIRLSFAFSNLNSNENIHIGLLYHSTFNYICSIFFFSLLSCAFSWNEWLNRRDSYYIPGCDKLMDLRIVLIQFKKRILLNMNLYTEYWGLTMASGRHCCAYIVNFTFRSSSNNAKVYRLRN